MAKTDATEEENAELVEAKPKGKKAKEQASEGKKNDIEPAVAKPKFNKS